MTLLHSCFRSRLKVKKYFTSSWNTDKMPCFRKSGTISFTLKRHDFPFSSQEVFLFYGALTLYSCVYAICAAVPFFCCSLDSCFLIFSIDNMCKYTHTYICVSLYICVCVYIYPICITLFLFNHIFFNVFLFYTSLLCFLFCLISPKWTMCSVFTTQEFKYNYQVWKSVMDTKNERRSMFISNVMICATKNTK